MFVTMWTSVGPLVVKLHEVKFKKLHGYLSTYYFGVSIEYIAFSIDGSLSLYTKLEGPSITKLDLFFPTI